MSLTFEQAAQALAATSRHLHSRGWVPATSGNFSARLHDGSIAITASGMDKGRLDPKQIMRVDLEGRPLEDRKPSAETALHVQLYRRDPSIGAVLHTHSLNSTLVSAHASGTISFERLELLKAFAGIDSHEHAFDIPVFANTQDIEMLATEVEASMARDGQGHAYLIRGHGIYTWGADLEDCMRHLEALEYLLEYHRLAGHMIGAPRDRH